ncbi:MAG: hypothetical protein LBH10_01815 [Burkholderiaceae bacterium]|nr:hypothetical protein [Burkholderiaceae bacterium]
MGGAGSGSATGMCKLTTTLPLVSLRLFDTPVGYTPPVGYDVHTTLTYNQRDTSQPASIDYSNIGPQWSASWVGFIQDDPTQPGVNVRRIAAGGGAYDYSGYNGASGAFTPEMNTQAQLVLVAQNPVTYERRFPDGSKEVYAASNSAAAYPRRVFLSRIVDPYGNTLTLNYDASLRLTSVQDAIGQSTTFTYGNTANTWLITTITDPFGRTAQLAYDSTGRLASITDAVGITSSFDYNGTSADISALHTPYGTTSFASTTADASRSLTITDPLGNASRTEFDASVTTLPDDPPPAASWADGNQGYRNTFYWDGEANARAPGDYTQAHIWHWLSSAASNPVVSDALESEKQPLDSRVWYFRNGQSSSNFLSGAQNNAPNQIARLLPNGATQLTQMAYAASGNPTLNIDPLGRQVQTAYDSAGIDVTAIQRKTAAGADTLAQFTYGATPHRPVTYTDAAGQVWRMSYNAQGQLLTVTDPLGNTTTNHYNTQGYLMFTLDALGQVVQTGYTYDNVGRVASITDSQGRTLNYQYDNLDRLTSINYFDGTSQTYTYTNLDLTAVKDRLGQVTRYGYDANRNLISVTDPAGHVTQYGYDRANRLISQTDANGSVTQWQRDIQGRVVAKIYPDNTQTTYAYDSAGRQSTRTDALGQTRQNAYAADGQLTGISYANAVNPTPAVTWQWDAYYPRITQMSDGAGITNYGYTPAGQNGAGQIQSEASAQGNIAYSYDALGRMASRTVNGKQDSWSYDVLGRVSGETNDLGQWQTSYLGQANQPASLTLQAPGAQVNPALQLLYSYGSATSGISNMGDRWLKSLTWQHASNIWTFNYQSDDLGRITSSQDAITPSPTVLTEGQQNYTYDSANRLTASQGQARQESYTTDPAGNLTGQSIATLTQPAAWTWQSQTNANNQNTVALQMQTYSDGSGGGSQYLPAYDANGQMLSDATSMLPPSHSNTRDTQWDAAGNLIHITDNVTGHITDISYDGWGRRVQMQEKANIEAATATITHYQWCGEKICQKLDQDGHVITEYFDQGEIHANDNSNLDGTNTGINLLYQKDQLGSIRGVMTPDGLQQGSRTYTAYGQTDQSSGMQPDKGYAGMFLHDSGLYLTWHRAYDPLSGRWLSHDPIGEEGGVNLYQYVNGDPVNYMDPFGLVQWNGTVISGGLTELVGASVFHFILTSECVNGQQAHISVWAVGPSIGVGTIPIGDTYSNINFDDHLNSLNPNEFNGLFMMSSAGSAFGIGGSFSKIRLGNVVSSGFGGSEYGLEFGLGATVGSSTVTDSEITSCGCGN